MPIPLFVGIGSFNPRSQGAWIQMNLTSGQRLKLTSGLLAGLLACSDAGTKSNPTEGVLGTGSVKSADEKGSRGLLRAFQPISAPEIEAKLKDLVAVHQPSVGKLAFMTKTGTSLVYDQAAGSVTSVDAAVRPKDALYVLALPDRHTWMVFKGQVARTIGDVNAGTNAKVLRLDLELPADGVRVIGVGNSWLAIAFGDTSMVITCDGKVLTMQKVSTPQLVFGDGGPRAGGKAADDKSLWFWGKDGLRSLSGANLAGAPWVRTQAYFDLKDSKIIKGAAFTLKLKGDAPQVPGDIAVLTDKGAFLSDVADETPPPATDQPSTPGGPLTFARDIKPLNDKYCISCHGAGAAAGDYSTEKTWVDDKDNVIARVDIPKKGQPGVMPTVGYPQQPTDDERNIMVKFLRGGTALRPR